MMDEAPSVLVVDDTVENLRLVAGMLASRGFDVRPVTSGPEALEAIAHDAPDLVLLDITMPQMSGIDVCRTLKQHAQWRDIPVIFLTALTDIADKVEGFAAGGADYITKPFQVEEVVARVSHHLALRRAQHEVKASLERLQALERLRDDLVHMIVHDMRSPISALVMNLEYSKTLVTGEARQALGEAVGSARTLSDMCNSLLDVSRLEEGKMPLQPAPCNLSSLADRVRIAMAPLDPRRSIDLIAPGTVMATCDVQLIRRVLENLVSNGIKHTPSGGRLRIEVAALPGRARISVQDEGPGVAPETRQRIFEKFGAVAHGQRYHSAGLGLAFCRLAVQAHGGHVGVDAAVPQGSIFWLELPEAGVPTA
jgi:two-component system sensor histidine kinase/response regulator